MTSFPHCPNAPNFRAKFHLLPAPNFQCLLPLTSFHHNLLLPLLPKTGISTLCNRLKLGKRRISRLDQISFLIQSPLDLLWTMNRAFTRTSRRQASEKRIQRVTAASQDTSSWSSCAFGPSSNHTYSSTRVWYLLELSPWVLHCMCNNYWPDCSSHG